MTKNFILISFFAMLLLFNQATAEEALQGDGTKNNPLELGWSNLIPDGFDPETLIKKFEKDLLRKLYPSYPSTRQLARKLGLSHTAIANKLREYGINKATVKI